MLSYKYWIIKLYPQGAIDEVVEIVIIEDVDWHDMLLRITDIQEMTGEDIAVEVLRLHLDPKDN